MHWIHILNICMSPTHKQTVNTNMDSYTQREPVERAERERVRECVLLRHSHTHTEPVKRGKHPDSRTPHASDIAKNCALRPPTSSQQYDLMCVRTYVFICISCLRPTYSYSGFRSFRWRTIKKHRLHFFALLKLLRNWGSFKLKLRILLRTEACISPLSPVS